MSEPADPAGNESLLELRDLRVSFKGPAGQPLRAVDGVSLSLRPRSTIGVVGESGCGKSTLALSILRLIPEPPGRIEGSILYRPPGRPPLEVLTLGDEELRALRGARISMIFQEPMTSLNPVYTAGDQVGEALRVHRGLSRKAARAEAARLFQQVGIADPERRTGEYPHQLSGGMRQRVMIAMALSCGPDLLIADEPTTALDVTIQAQILELLGELQRALGMSVLLITHDLGVVAQLCDDVVVMYAGQVVEQGAARAVLSAPRHPYTAGLLRSVPRLRSGATTATTTPITTTDGRRPRLQEIPGMVPRLDALPAGCRFQDRCPGARPECQRVAPPLAAAGGAEPGRLVRCHFPLAPAAALGVAS